MHRRPSSAPPLPVADAKASLSIPITTSYLGADTGTVASGDFCPADGQGGNADCTGSGTPQACCTGSGTGSCTAWNGCFGSNNYSDTMGTCTRIQVSGRKAGLLLIGDPNPPIASYGGIGCVPAVSAGGFTPLANGAFGLPGPVAGVARSALRVQ